MYTFISFYLLFHHNLIIFLVLGTVLYFYLRPNVSDNFVMGKFPGNEPFGIDIASPFSAC